MPAVTGILRPVVCPEEVEPIDTKPVKLGARVTDAPGTGAKLLLPAGAEYN